MSMRARRDGVELEAGAARELWARFSAWMEAHPGDLAGFAAELGAKSVRPALDPGGPVLVVSTTDAQAAYGNAKAVEAPKKREKGAAHGSTKGGKSQGTQRSHAHGPARPKQPR